LGHFYRYFHKRLRQVSGLAAATVTFDVKGRSATPFPVLMKPKVVFNGQPAADRSIYCIKLVYEVDYREFVYAISGLFLLAVFALGASGHL